MKMNQQLADMMARQLSGWFTAQRKHQGLTQSQVGDFMLAGGQGSVSCLERNATQWRLDQIASYCQAIGLSQLTLRFEFPAPGAGADDLAPELQAEHQVEQSHD